MNWRNRIGLYGAYFLGMSGIGFTLPYLPLYLREQGMSNRDIGIISTVAALAGLAQFPLGIWSDRIKRRKPFLIVLLGVLALSTWLLQNGSGYWLAFLVVLFAENGICRATSESLFGAEVAQVAPPDQVGTALGILRFWKPLGIIAVAMMGGVLVDGYGVAAILAPLAVVQGLAVVAVMLIHEKPWHSHSLVSTGHRKAKAMFLGLRDGTLWIFVVAMVLFHVANAPGGVYLGLFLKTDLHAADALLSYAFIISMLAWMVVIRPVGRLVDRFGRKPLLVVGWTIMTFRLLLVAVAQAPWQILAIQVLDGLAQAIFIVAAGAWMTDRVANHERVGEAQVLVGSALVAGSAIGPTLSAFVVDSLGYRSMFWLLTGIGTIATLIVVILVPEAQAKSWGKAASELSEKTPELAPGLCVEK